MRAFAADPSTPPALAGLALAWHEHIHYGLWRIDDPVPSPGLWCTDIVSGTERDVEFPAEATAVLPRWSVWLGGIVPVDGVWRSTGLGVRLSPAEGDAAAEFVGQASVAMLFALQGKPERPPTAIPFGQASARLKAAPHCRPRAGRSTGSMRRSPRCTAARQGRPRSGANGRTWRLRQFEYEADLLAAGGESGIDTAWLREQLNMPSYLDG